MIEYNIDSIWLLDIFKKLFRKRLLKDYVVYISWVSQTIRFIKL
jgi:hypothetical protein